MARDKLCAEPVDRVYSLLGLLGETARQALPIDYSAQNRNNPWPLFTSLGKFKLNTEGFQLFVLLSSSKVPEGVASWLPNLLGPGYSQNLYFERAGFPPDGYDSVRYQPAITTYPEKDEIEVHGLRLDKVDSFVKLPWT
jgi:hypothetical protein